MGNTTITPEERAKLREKNMQWHGMWPGEDSEIIIRLLDALESAEDSIKEISKRLNKAGAISVGCSARAEQAEAEVAMRSL